jgi:O-antigen/teichoic acid export membrane protein
MNTAFGRAAAFKAVVWTTGSTYIAYVLGLLSSVLVARGLGADDFGRYAYLVWLSGVLVLIANNGLNNTAIKFISEAMGRDAPSSAASIHGWLRRLQAGSIALTAVIYLIVLPWVRPAGWEGHVGALAIAVTASFVFRSASLFNTSVAKGYGRFTIEAITNSGAAFVNMAFVVVLTWMHASVEAYIFMFALTSASYLIISTSLWRRTKIAAGPPDLESAIGPRLRRHLLWTASMAAIGALGTRSIETFLLNRWVGTAEVGFFAIATNLSRAAVDLLAAGLSTVMMPVMGFVLGTGDHARMQRVFADATRYYQYLGLLIAGVGICWARVVVSVMYGEQYMPIVPILRILIAMAGLLLANGAFSALLASSDHPRFRVGVMILSIVISWPVAFALIPAYGLLGAALAQVLSSVLSTTVIVIGIQRSVGLGLPWLLLARQYALALGAGIVALAIIVLGQESTFAELAAGVVYGALMLLVSLVAGVWRPDEKRRLAETVSRYPRLAWLARLLVR